MTLGDGGPSLLSENEAHRMTAVSGDTDWAASERIDDPRDSLGARGQGQLGQVLDLTESPWRGAFKAAGRHSARVRFLRRAIVGLCVVAVGVVLVVGLFDPFRRLPRNLTIGQVHVDGTRITVESPKITGFQKDGNPYEVTARAGIQDTTTPNIVELQGIDARIGLNDASTLQVLADHGVYDSLHDRLAMDGSAQIKNDVRYSIFMKTAQMDFKTGSLISKERVKVVLQGGVVAADQMDIENDGKVSFEGDIKSVIESGANEKGTATNPVVAE